jgi:hypothetical protein
LVSERAICSVPGQCERCQSHRQAAFHFAPPPSRERRLWRQTHLGAAERQQSPKFCEMDLRAVARHQSERPVPVQLGGDCAAPR